MKEEFMKLSTASPLRIFIRALLFVAIVFSTTIDPLTGQTAESGLTIDVLAYGDDSNAQGVAWRRIVDAFEAANPTIDIQYELLYDREYHERVIARLASGDVPDLAYMGADALWGTPWAEAGQQVDHRPWLDSSFYDLSLIPPMGPNGEIYEIPQGTSNMTTVLFMNETLVNELGFDAPETYADLVAMVPAARAAGKTVVSIDGADAWAWGSCLMSTFIARLSGDPNWVSKAVAGQFKFTDRVFVDSLNLISRMIDDGVLDRNAVFVDYGTNLSNFSSGKTLFMVQGQWASSSIDPVVADNTQLLAWPELPGEQAAAAGTVAAAINAGYGLTKDGASLAEVRDAALEFLRFFHSHEETAQRLRDNAIVAPILKDFQIPSDLPAIQHRKILLSLSAERAGITDIIDQHLPFLPNADLTVGMQQIAAGDRTGAQVAERVQANLERQ